MTGPNSHPHLSRAERIARDNDTFRRSGLGIFMTQGALQLPDRDALLGAIRNYNEFEVDNDPWAEHDFGSLSWWDKQVYWKIDYYDAQLQHGEDPLHPTCQRIMTIMLADES